MKKETARFRWMIKLGVILMLSLLYFNGVLVVRAEEPFLLPFSNDGHVLGFGEDGFYLSNGSYLFKTTFVGAQTVMPQSDAAATAGSQANSSLPLSQVTYPNLWPGISLHYDRGVGLVRSTYTVEAGADPANIRLQYNIPAKVNSSGSLSLTFETGRLTESAPVAWQEIGEKKFPVAVSFQVDSTGHEIGFTLAEYNPRYPLLIDPTLTWNTFLGGTSFDFGYGIALDDSSNVYVVGDSRTSWGNPVRNYAASNDAFVAKLDAVTGTLTWNTYLGGIGFDHGSDIAVDSNNVYITGYSNFVSWGNPVRPLTGVEDAFVAQLDAATGVLNWNTFLGGMDDDQGHSIDVDGIGNVYVTGKSEATWGSPVRSHSGFRDAFVSRLEANSGILTWHTFLGAVGFEEGFSVAVDEIGNVYATGSSSSSWGSPVRPYTSGADIFVVRLDPATGLITWNTYLGGTGQEFGYSISIAGNGSAYVTGYGSANWGTPVRPYSIGNEAFAARLDTATGELTWHTFLGGTGDDRGRAIVEDNSGNVYVSGYSNATWGSPVRSFTNNDDTYVARLDAATGALTWNSFMGGTGEDQGYGIDVDDNGNVYVTGYSDASWGSPVRTYTASTDAFVASVPQPCINSSTSGLWNNNSTWQGGTVPPSTEGACILNGHTVTLDISPQIQQLLVETGGTLVIPSGFSLTAENFVTSSGTMVQTLPVNSANVPFLEIRNQANTMVKYRGVTLNTSNNLGDMTVQVREIGEGEHCTGNPLSPTYARRCYEITANNNLPANVRLWSLSSDLNGIAEANLTVYRFNNSWTALTTSRTTGTDGGDYSYAEGDTPGFSDFLLGDQNSTPTAVTLSTFSTSSLSPMLLMIALLLVLWGMTVWVRRRASR